jgi:hypothetical protein
VPPRRRAPAAPAFEHPELLTRAEHSRWTETSRHAEVEAFCGVLAARSRRVRLLSMGKSGEGRDMPVLVLSTGGASTPASARRAGRAVVLVQANIHAGEVEGKESVLMLARELALAPREPAVLRRLTLVLVPDFNPDGNDRISTANRALDLRALEGQIGPPGGVGIRYTGAGWNLNRDHVKHDAVEMRAMARLNGEWDPHLFVDCHTTDGSIHGYDLTFDTAHNPRSGHPAPIALLREGILPEVARRLRRRNAIHAGFYGNFVDEARPEAGWATYPALPRFGSHYRGLRGRGDVLLETYSYIDFERRCRAMLATLRTLIAVAAERAGPLREACARADRETTEAGLDPRADDLVGVNYGVARRGDDGALLFDYPAHEEGEVVVRSVDRKSIRAHRLPGTRGVRLAEYRCPHLRKFVPTASVPRPWGWLVPADLGPRLAAHGVRFARSALRGTIDAEVSVVVAIERTSSPDVTGSTEPAGGGAPGTRPPGSIGAGTTRWETVLSVRRERRRMAAPAGMLLVKAAQPLGNLALYLLEPESDDGFARWGFLDGEIRAGQPFPVIRLPRPL